MSKQKPQGTQFQLTFCIVVLVFIILMSLVLISLRHYEFATDETENATGKRISLIPHTELIYFRSSSPDVALPIPPLFGETLLSVTAMRDNGQFEEAENALRTMLLYYPESPAVLRLLADVFYQQKKYENAEQIYKKQLALSPKNPVFLNDLAMSQGMQNKFDDAIRNLERAITVSGQTFPAAEWNLSAMYLRANKKEEALSCFINVLRRTPPEALSGRQWDPVFAPLLEDAEVKRILREKGGAE